MTARLTLICHAPTGATREARFPADEALHEAPEEAVDGIGPGLAAARVLPAARQPAARHRLAGPERRCRETAAAFGGDFAVDAALRDQDFGRWAGRGLADVAAAEPDAMAAWMGDPAAAPHGGESVEALLLRVEGWMAGPAAAGGRTVAVTHPAVVRAAVSAALGAGVAGAAAAAFWRIEAPPLARAVLSHDGRRWALAGLLPPP